MILDNNKGITNITYNHLNLPKKITFAGNNSITYIYNALGVKLRKEVNEGDTQATTHYMGTFQYNNNNLQYIHTSEGYVRHTPPTSGTNYGAFDYVYNYTDHLGNVRLSYTLDPSDQQIKILEENHYYPFGMKHSYNTSKKDVRVDEAFLNPNLTPSENGNRRVEMVSNSGYQYKYNGKEYQDELGLAMYDYGARNYDPAIGRWMNIDPLAEKYPNWSPYAFCYNNPINVIDPDGREGIVVSGGEYNSDDRYKYNFIEPAITRLKELKSAGGDEPITWAVMTAGYSDSDLEKFQAIASDLGVGFQPIGSADEFTNYLNSKDIGSSDLSEARSGDQITSMSVFGHGYAGSAEFAHRQDNQASFSWSTDNVSQLNKGAFNNATIDLFTCNSSTNTASGGSLGSTLSSQTGSVVTGYRGQSTYKHMNIGQGLGDRINRKWNGFNTNGSQRMPQAGEGATRIKHLPPKKK